MPASPMVVVAFSPGGGHAQRLLPLVAGLKAHGAMIHVLTRGEMRAQIEAAGGTFHDLFGRFPIDVVDGESIPLPSRFVTFAAAYAAPIAAYLARLRPQLVVYDSFMVVAPIVARQLGVPYVSLRAGHAQVPAQAMAAIARDPRVRTSTACHDAVHRLREEHGLSDAGPFSYLDGLSPHLNLYPEPEPFLSAEERKAFEPVACFGSLAPELREAASCDRPFARDDGNVRVYVSFGTVIWRYYASAALAALEAVADALSVFDARAVVSLGGYAGGVEGRRLPKRRIRVEPYVDQWGALKDADVFVTHQGLNSTHEAIYHQVPMLSYPFFGDQPAMAECCHRLGVALPLSDEGPVPLDAERVGRQMSALLASRETFLSRLAEAKRWELDTIANRHAILGRLLQLV